jgi:hypothetical protein
MKRELREKLQGAPHLVPLPAVLRGLEPLTGGGRFIFRGERHHDRPMSENTINAALRATGFPADEVTWHGFRATARTMLHERLGFDPNVIEAQLAHSVRDSLGRAYNRTEFVEQRRAMLQKWADGHGVMGHVGLCRGWHMVSCMCGSRNRVPVTRARPKMVTVLVSSTDWIYSSCSLEV